MVLLVRIFLLNTNYSAKGCEWPSLKSKGIINAQYHEDKSSVLQKISVMLVFFFCSCLELLRVVSSMAIREVIQLITASDSLPLLINVAYNWS